MQDLNGRIHYFHKIGVVYFTELDLEWTWKYAA